MGRWSLVYEEFDPEKETLRETLCTLGNGYFCTRGAAEEAENDGSHYPGTYIAGGYNRMKTEIDGQTSPSNSLPRLFPPARNLSRPRKGHIAPQQRISYSGGMRRRGR